MKEKIVMSPRRLRNNILANELKTFRAHHQELGATSAKFVLIKGDQILGTYDTEADAIKEGYAKNGAEAFLVKRIANSDAPVLFTSHLLEV